MTGVKVRTKRKIYGVLSPNHEKCSIPPNGVGLVYAFQNTTVLGASKIRAHEKGMSLWRGDAMSIPLKLRKQASKDGCLIEHSSEFVETLNRLLGSDWIGIYGGQHLVDFVKKYKEVS